MLLQKHVKFSVWYWIYPLCREVPLTLEIYGINLQLHCIENWFNLAWGAYYNYMTLLGLRTRGRRNGVASDFFCFFPFSSVFCPFSSVGIVQKVFSEKASAIARMRQKCVKNASEMRQNGSCFIGKRGRSKMRQKLRQKCVKNARNTFGGEHLLDDTFLPFHFQNKTGRHRPRDPFCETPTLRTTIRLSRVCMYCNYFCCKGRCISDFPALMVFTQI